jgi:sulfur carrier protein
MLVVTTLIIQAMSNASNLNSISLQVNGEPKTCAPHTPLPQLLEQLNMNPRLVAVEYNGEILHRQFWQETEIQEGDRLEIVTIVGGG